MTDFPPPSASPASAGDEGEENRAFLQRRVSLFWKVIFFIVLSSVAVGLGEIAWGAKPGWDDSIIVASALMAGGFWWACRTGERSFEFSRFMEAGALGLHMLLGAFVVRYSSGDFLEMLSLETLEASWMADGLFLMMAQGGSAMLVAIRAALVPSLPGRTAVVTLLVGIPLLLIPELVAPVSGISGSDLGEVGAGGAPRLTAMRVMLWFYAVLTCTVISSVIYGLRKEAREAHKLGQYVLGRKLGAGGMGEVFEASHGMMRRPCAIKLLKAQSRGEASLRRFEQEVQLTARLTHPNTITVFDFGRTADNIFYYAMELLDGATLQKVVQVSGSQTQGRVVRILSMARRALSEAHDLGLIHRDIKPANIMLCRQGGELDVVKLLDFGLVKEIAMDRDVQLTHADAITGTPQYLAPEAIVRPDAVDARSDIYALGAVAYYLLAGKEVFNGQTVVEVCSQHLHQQVQPLSTHGVEVSAELEAVVLACLAKEQSKRPQSARDLRERLQACPQTPWGTDEARAWWTQYPCKSTEQAASRGLLSQTLAVDGGQR